MAQRCAPAPTAAVLGLVALVALVDGCGPASQASSAQPRNGAGGPVAFPPGPVDPGAACRVRVAGPDAGGGMTFDEAGRQREEEWLVWGCLLRGRYRHDEGGNLAELTLDYECPGGGDRVREQPLLGRDHQVVRWRRDPRGRPLEVETEFGVAIPDRAASSFLTAPGEGRARRLRRDAYAFLGTPPPLPPAHVERGRAFARYTYDASGRVASLHYRTELPEGAPLGADTRDDHTETWTYADARTVSRALAFDEQLRNDPPRRVDYALDEKGRLASLVEVGPFAVPSRTRQARYTYGPDGRLAGDESRETSSTGPAERRQYAYASGDANDLRLRHAGGSASSNYDFAYLPDGLLASATELLPVSDAEKDKPPSKQVREKHVTTYQYAGACRAPLRGLTPTVATFMLEPWHEMNEGNPLPPTGSLGVLRKPPLNVVWR